MPSTPALPRAKTLRALGDIRSIADVEALERWSYEDLIPAKSVYDLFVNAAQFCGDRPAVTVLGSADPTDVEVNSVARGVSGRGH